MNIHSRARTTPRSRALLLLRVWRDGWTARQAAEAAGVSERTFYKWQRRYAIEGWQGLFDRSSRPRRSPLRLPRKLVEKVLELRKRFLSGLTISQLLGIGRSTVSRHLRAARLSRVRDLVPREPVRRYERETPGDLLHLDVKKLGRFHRVGHRIHGDRRKASRGAGWEYLHVCVDDHTRLAYAEVLDDEKGGTAARFLARAVGWFQQIGVKVQAVLTDNGSCYQSKPFSEAAHDLQLALSKSRPYHPQTNGKAERFIQTCLREWAYARSYATSGHRTRELLPWLHYYNAHRPHFGISGNIPASRLSRPLNNVSSHNS